MAVKLNGDNRNLTKRECQCFKFSSYVVTIYSGSVINCIKCHCRVRGYFEANLVVFLFL